MQCAYMVIIIQVHCTSSHKFLQGPQVQYPLLPPLANVPSTSQHSTSSRKFLQGPQVQYLLVPLYQTCLPHLNTPSRLFYSCLTSSQVSVCFFITFFGLVLSSMTSFTSSSCSQLHSLCIIPYQVMGSSLLLHLDAPYYLLVMSHNTA